MKKAALFIIMAILLCFVMAAGFWLVTQRGVLADEIIVFSKDSSTILLTAKSGQRASGFLLDAVKSTDKLESAPVNYTETFTIRVTYKPDLPMKYLCKYDPYTGQGCIEKGLIEKNYYVIPAETMDYLAGASRVSLYKMTGVPHPEAIDPDYFREIAKTLEYVNGTLEPSSQLHEYRIKKNSLLNPDMHLKLLVDTENAMIYLDSPTGYYNVDGKFVNDLLSMDNIYNDYKADRQQLPEISLTAGISIVPVSVSTDWSRINPAGDRIKDSAHTDYRPTDQAIEPGTPLKAVYADENTPDILTLAEYRNGILFHEYDLLETDASVPDFEGDLSYVLTAAYNSLPDSSGTIIMDYSFKMTLPSTPVMVYHEARPGDVLAFRIDFGEDDETFTLESNLGKFSETFMPYGDSLIIYMPINWWTSPKEYSATIYQEKDGTKEVFAEYTLTVMPDDFVTVYQQLVVSDELAEKADPANTANDYIMVREAKSHSNETSYLDGLFIMPLNGELGTSYAQTRYINGENPYRHSGLDIDGETGDPIVAANRGEIVFAGELVRTGITVIIDHGMELFTSYLHMSELDVQTGDFVEKGDLIGKVGSTGFSTGPHLHWSVTLYGNYISPLWLVENPIVPTQ